MTYGNQGLSTNLLCEFGPQSLDHLKHSPLNQWTCKFVFHFPSHIVATPPPPPNPSSAPQWVDLCYATDVRERGLPLLVNKGEGNILYKHEMVSANQVVCCQQITYCFRQNFLSLFLHFFVDRITQDQFGQFRSILAQSQVIAIRRDRNIFKVIRSS